MSRPRSYAGIVAVIPVVAALASGVGFGRSGVIDPAGGLVALVDVPEREVVDHLPHVPEIGVSDGAAEGGDLVFHSEVREQDGVGRLTVLVIRRTDSASDLFERDIRPGSAPLQSEDANRSIPVRSGEVDEPRLITGTAEVVSAELCGLGVAFEIGFQQDDVLAVMEVIKPRDVPRREVLVVIATRNDYRDIVGNEVVQGLFGGVEVRRSEVPGVEQVAREEDGVDVGVVDSAEGVTERRNHVVLTLFEAVLSVSEVGISEVCESHVVGVDGWSGVV
jgi:hypothetical protein